MSETTSPTEQRTKVKVLKGGPLMIEGLFTIMDKDGIESHKDKAFLCRCGGSKNKPYCDGTHKTIEFDK